MVGAASTETEWELCTWRAQRPAEQSPQWSSNNACLFFRLLGPVWERGHGALENTAKSLFVWLGGELKKFQRGCDIWTAFWRTPRCTRFIDLHVIYRFFLAHDALYMTGPVGSRYRDYAATQAFVLLWCDDASSSQALITPTSTSALTVRSPELTNKNTRPHANRNFR